MGDSTFTYGDLIINTELGICGSEITVTEKNQHRIYLKDGAGNPLFRSMTAYWTTGSGFLSTTGSGFGIDAMQSNSKRDCNGFGFESLKLNEGDYSNGFGYQALYNCGSIGGNGFGYKALYHCSGVYCNGFGYEALYSNIAQYCNGFGKGALKNNGGNACSGFGDNALHDNNAAYCNGFGVETLYFNTGAFSNGFGNYALGSNIAERCNGFGERSLENNTGLRSNGFGFGSLEYNLGNDSNGFGYYSLEYNSGINCNGLGNNSLLYNVASNVIGIGNNSLLYSNWADVISIGNQTSGSFNVDDSTIKPFASADIDAYSGEVTFGAAHGFGIIGNDVNLRFNVLTGTPPDGLITDTVYRCTVISATIILMIKIETQGAGTYTLTKDLDATNSVSIGKNVSATKANQVIIGSSIAETLLRGSVGIGNSPDINCALDIVSTIKGARLPCMTTTQRTALTGVEGLEVYDTSLHKKCLFTATTWEVITSA